MKNDDFDEFNDDDLEDCYDVITMVDEFSEEKEFLVLDVAKMDEVNYLLVIESESSEDDEAEAIIIKENSSDEETSLYSVVEDDEEFSKVAALFQKDDKDYNIEF